MKAIFCTVFSIAVLSALFLGAEVARADLTRPGGSYYYTDFKREYNFLNVSFSTGKNMANAAATVRIDKLVYQPGETLVASGNLDGFTGLDNGSSGITGGYLQATFNGITKDVFNTSASFNIPSTAYDEDHTYGVVFTGMAQWGSEPPGTSSVTLEFTVPGTAVKSNANATSISADEYNTKYCTQGTACRAGCPNGLSESFSGRCEAGFGMSYYGFNSVEITNNPNPVSGTGVDTSEECLNVGGICASMAWGVSGDGKRARYSLTGSCAANKCALQKNSQGQYQADCYCWKGNGYVASTQGNGTTNVSYVATGTTTNSSICGDPGTMTAAICSSIGNAATAVKTGVVSAWNYVTGTTSQSPSPQNTASFVSSRTSGANRAGMTSAECRNAGGSACYSRDGSEASDAARFEYKGDCQDNRICLAERTSDPTLTFEQSETSIQPRSRTQNDTLNDDGCKSLYGKNTAACLTPDADAKGMYDTEKKCQTANGSEGTCFATKFQQGFFESEHLNAACQNQDGKCVGGIPNGCTDSSWSVPIGVCSQRYTEGNTMCCKQATDGNSCQGGGLICKQSNGETDDAAVCGANGLILDTSGKTCPSGNPKQVCCVNKEIQDQAIASNPLPAFAATSVPLENPLQYESIPEALQGILNALRGVVVVLALIFLIIGALLYIVSGGDEGRIKTAKLAITAALIGLAIAIAAPAFLNEISSVLGWSAPDSELSGALTLSAILMNTLNFLLGIIGIAALIMLIIGSLSYLSSGGDDKRIDSAKGIVRYSLIGIAVAFGSLIVIKQVVKFFE